MVYHQDMTIQIKRNAKDRYPLEEHNPDYSVFSCDGHLIYEHRDDTKDVFVPLKPQDGFCITYDAHLVRPTPDYCVFRLIIDDGEKAAIWSIGKREKYVGQHIRRANSVAPPKLLPGEKLTFKQKLAAKFGKKYNLMSYTLIQLEVYRVIKDPFEQFELHGEDNMGEPYATIRFFCFDPDQLAQICPIVRFEGRRHSFEDESAFASSRYRTSTPFPTLHEDKPSIAKRVKSVMSLRSSGKSSFVHTNF